MGILGDSAKVRVLGEAEVLNHGIIRLLDFMGSDLSIVRAARVSYDAAWRSGEDANKDKKLMRRLWRGSPEPTITPSGNDRLDAAILRSMEVALPQLPKHSTPFEACTLTFEIMAPVFVFRQWHRHRTQSYNELSARYRELPETYYLPTPEVIGVQSLDNKQGRDLDFAETLIYQRNEEIEWVRAHCEQSFSLYRKLLDAGWPKELARIVLPFGTYSHMFCTMNLLNFFKFANLRADPHAQYEIRVYAEKMIDMVAEMVPMAAELFKEANTPAF
jgi:thymidylate synthase (FAD)